MPLFGVALAALVASTVFLTSLSQAAGPDLYGRRFVRLEALRAPEEAAGAVKTDKREAEPQLTRLDAEAYKAQIREFERRAGPYAADLTEPLLQIAHHYRHQGAIDQALAALGRALHVLRVNAGLHSPEQRVILRAQLDALRGAQRHTALDQRYDYFLRVHGGVEAPLTEARMEALLEYLQWQREAIQLGLGRDILPRLLGTQQLTNFLLDAAVQPASTQGGELSSSWQAQLALAQIKNLYLIKNHRLPVTVDDTFGDVPGYRRESPFEYDHTVARFEKLQSSADTRGVRVLEAAIEAQGDGSKDPIMLARLYLALGDWQLWLGNTRAVAEPYRQVIAHLTKAGETALLQRWLSQPVELPANGLYVADGAPLGEPILLPERYTLQFDVDTRGRAVNVRPLTTGGRERRLVRAVRSIRFRPRWVNGYAESVGGVEREYVLLN